jgi:hypothetical protein
MSSGMRCALVEATKAVHPPAGRDQAGDSPAFPESTPDTATAGEP